MSLKNSLKTVVIALTIIGSLRTVLGIHFTYFWAICLLLFTQDRDYLCQ